MNTKLLLTFSISFLVFFSANSQVYDWVSEVSGANDVRSNGVVFDHHNNSYNTGYFKGTIDADPGSNVFSISSNGNKDIYIQKLNDQGDLLWVKQIGGAFEDEATGIAIDQSGNICITGFFKDIVDFDPDSAIHHLSSNGDLDAFILKLDSLGNFIWAGNVGGISIDKATDIAIDKNDNILISGYFLGLADFDPGIVTYNMNSQGMGGFNSFVLKLDLTGDFKWAKNIGGDNQSQGNGITTDNNGNVYSTGYFKGTSDLDPSSNDFDVTAIGDKDIYVQKLDSNGFFQWGASAGGTGTDIGYDLVANKNENCYVTGYFNGNVDFDPSNTSFFINSSGGSDAFVWKFNQNGLLDWAHKIGGGGLDRGEAINLDTLDNVYTTGIFSGNVDMDPSNNSATQSSLGSQDVFIQKMNPTGQYLWSTSFGGSGSDAPNAIAINQQEDIITAGYFEGAVDFNPDAGVDVVNSLGGDDAFVHKMILCIPSLTVTACESYTSPSGLYTWDSTGIYYDTLSYHVNCDSIIIVDLEILKASYDSVLISTCGSFHAPSGAVYTNTGTYTDTITNHLGCDSIVTYDLVILPPSYDTISITSCNEYYAPSGAIFTSSGWYLDTIINQQGCDSILNIDLSILNTSFSTVDTATCTDFASPSGIYNWSSTGTYFDTLLNLNGCDSIIQFNLTINEPSDSIINSNNILSALTDSANYQWLDCDNDFLPIIGETSQNYQPTQNGNYAVQVSINSCTDTTNCVEFILSAVHEEFENTSVLAYPNPTNDWVTIVTDDLSFIKIELYDQLGSKLTSTSDRKLSLNSYEKGVYFLKIFYQNKTSVIRILKQ